MSATPIVTDTIPYDRMKEQVEKELALFLDSRQGADFPSPRIGFEKGASSIAFPLRRLDEPLLFASLALMKNHLANVRVHSFGDGYYAFQAMNDNLFNTGNLLDNYKVEFLGLSANFRIEISKKGNFTQDEITLAIALYKNAYADAVDDPVARLTRLGADVYTERCELDWSYIAGYEEVKRRIRESIIMPLQNPGVYDSITRLTRKTFESNRPRAILFEGSPGVGKTTIARIIASDVAVPLVYVPIESIMSKWYGQSSQNLASIFDAAEELGGAILFFDEIDALAGSRDQNMFEATRRILSVLLRRLDGIESTATTITIAATNRKNDLDHALISRFDQSIFFPLPNEAERAAIFSNYAVHLKTEEAQELAKITKTLSGRNIKDVCEMTERRWARKLIIRNMPPAVPPFEYYKNSARVWAKDNAIVR